MKERAGWELNDIEAPKPPIASVVNVVDLLIGHAESSAELPRDHPHHGWLEIRVHQFTIRAGRLVHQAIFRWNRSSHVDQSLGNEGASTGSLSAELSRLPALQEGTMEAHRRARLRAEREALRELSEEKPATPKERQMLLEKRKREFDEAWGIEPKSLTDHTPIRLVK